MHYKINKDKLIYISEYYQMEFPDEYKEKRKEYLDSKWYIEICGMREYKEEKKITKYLEKLGKKYEKEKTKYTHIYVEDEDPIYFWKESTYEII